MKRKHNSNFYAGAAALILVAGVLVEASRLILQVPWEGWSLWFSNVISAVLATLWSAAALGLVLRHRHREFARTAWVLSLFAPLAMVFHGLFVRLGGQAVGLFYVAGGLLTGFFLKRCWDGSEFRWLRRTTSSTVDAESRGAH